MPAAGQPLRKELSHRHVCSLTHLLGRLNGYRILLRDGDNGWLAGVVLLTFHRASKLRAGVSTRDPGLWRDVTALLPS